MCACVFLNKDHIWNWEKTIKKQSLISLLVLNDPFTEYMHKKRKTQSEPFQCSSFSLSLFFHIDLTLFTRQLCLSFFPASFHDDFEKFIEMENLLFFTYFACAKIYIYVYSLYSFTVMYFRGCSAWLHWKMFSSII